LTEETTVLGKTIKRFAVVAIALPVAAAGVRKISQEIEQRRGSNSATRLMRQVADMMHAPGSRRRRFGRR
jgi:hypothetical protein